MTANELPYSPVAPGRRALRGSQPLDSIARAATFVQKDPTPAEAQRRGEMNKQQSSLRLSVSAGKSPNHRTRTRPNLPPPTHATRAAITQELYDAITTANSRRDAETLRNEQTAKPSASQRLSGKIAPSPYTNSARSSSSDPDHPRRGHTGTL